MPVSVVPAGGPEFCCRWRRAGACAQVRLTSGQGRVRSVQPSGQRAGLRHYGPGPRQVSVTSHGIRADPGLTAPPRDAPAILLLQLQRIQLIRGVLAVDLTRAQHHAFGAGAVDLIGKGLRFQAEPVERAIVAAAAIG